MRVLFVASEAVPYCKTGGLADVTGALFKELKKMGINVLMVLPYYRQLIRSDNIVTTGLRIEVRQNSRSYLCSLYTSTDKDTLFIDIPELFDREGIYGDTRGDYPDNDTRFSIFSRATLMAVKSMGFQPDVIHMHDWHTALIPLYLKTIHREDAFFVNTATVLTIHNLGYQGLFPPGSLKNIGISPAFFTPEGIEFYGKVNFLKAGIVFSDVITTVSSRYAEEITTEEYGFGLDGVLRRRRDVLYGVINGIEYDRWSPEIDPYIHAHYHHRDLRGKALCKKDLLSKINLDVAKNTPVMAFIGRLATQKGVDLLVDNMDRLFRLGVVLVVLGTGDERYERLLMDKQSRYPDVLYVDFEFNESLAHKIYAGADMMLMPSRYEPCGLVQLISLRYGTIPVARSTGGLTDSIEDFDPLKKTGTGFLFDDYNGSAFLECVKRAIVVFTVKSSWHRIMREAMLRDFSWNASARQYLQIYQEAVKRRHEHKG